jgi:hypothetical protein
MHFPEARNQKSFCSGPVVQGEPPKRNLQKKLSQITWCHTGSLDPISELLASSTRSRFLVTEKGLGWAFGETVRLSCETTCFFGLRAGERETNFRLESLRVRLLVLGWSSPELKDHKYTAISRS